MPLSAQPGKAKEKNGKLKMKVYLAKIKTTSGKKIKAWLYDTDEEKIYLVSKSTNLFHITKLEPTSSIAVNEVKTLKLRRRNSIGKGLGRGALAGAGLGFLFGVTNSGAFADGDKPVTYGGIMSVFGLMGGSVVGAVFGSLNKDSFNWNGEQEKYNKVKERLRAYSIKAQLPDKKTD